MFDRRCLAGSFVLGLAVLLAGCASPSLESITITPNTQFFGYAPGLTAQFTATGTFGQGNHPKITRDITSEVTWKSSSPGIATVSAAGLVTSTGVDLRLNGHHRQHGWVHWADYSPCHGPGLRARTGN